MKNIKVRTKLIVSFMIVAVLAVVVGGVGIFGMRQLRDSGDYMYQKVVLPMPNLSSAEETMLTIRISVREMVIASMVGDFNEVEREFRNIERLMPVMDGFMNAYKTQLIDAEMIRLFDEAKNVYENDLVPVVLSIYSASQRADIEAILGKLEACRQYSDKILEIFQKCFDTSVSYAQEASNNAANLAQTLLVMIVIALVVASAATVFLAFYISDMISSPLGLLVRAFEKVAVGDLTERLPKEGKDEIAKASKSYNQTMEEFSKMIVSIVSRTADLSSTGSDLSTNMDKTASTVNEITANVRNIKGLVTNQSAGVSETHATMEQVVANINKLNSHIENQSSYISNASSSIEEMVANTRSVTETLVKNTANVKALAESAEAGRGGLQEVATDIQEIARESEGLMEINSVMQKISSQTNLLSMNAAIEAAHAGDAGKGFAVVADEIRKLSENSGEQSKSISAVLKKIKSSIDKISRSTEKVLNKFEDMDASVKIVADQEERIRTAMEDQEAGSKQILDGISGVNEITRQVIDGSHEMLEGAKKVIRESELLENATKEITLGMNEMAIGAEGINVAVNHVNDISRKNREGIDVLIGEVSRFRVN